MLESGVRDRSHFTHTKPVGDRTRRFIFWPNQGDHTIRLKVRECPVETRSSRFGGVALVPKGMVQDITQSPVTRPLLLGPFKLLPQDPNLADDRAIS